MDDSIWLGPKDLNVAKLIISLQNQIDILKLDNKRLSIQVALLAARTIGSL